MVSHNNSLIMLIWKTLGTYILPIRHNYFQNRKCTHRSRQELSTPLYRRGVVHPSFRVAGTHFLIQGMGYLPPLFPPPSRQRYSLFHFGREGFILSFRAACVHFPSPRTGHEKFSLVIFSSLFRDAVSSFGVYFMW